MNGIADILRESSLKPAKSVPQPMWEVPGVEPDFDVIIIGGGVAGTVAAYQLSRAGHDVLLIERGQEPGSKNLSGGRSLLPSSSRNISRLSAGCPGRAQDHTQPADALERRLICRP
ncbi:hypothetical protein HMPREF9607_00989 [Cutibacterium modestum HL044PA1]|uniref:FAD dependent oxidoreductase domain-containing protein n=1 Tax=Cutibacterium modestum HL044PA1 TaxID=765109 RepID=A0ABN0C660_9ACTN|nr:hypothetical protein HMPREF9607_00989 [Cutibacterium modestum HL044PA1]